jgi:hypothetical protein
MKKLFLILAGIMFLAVTTSCEHKDLCYNHPEHAHKYHIKVVADYRLDWEECYGGPDWEANWPENYLDYNSLRPGKPSGLRVVNNDVKGNSNTHNIAANGGVVTLYEGVNDLLFYNNDTEYILFSRINDMSGASTRATTRATTRTRTRATYMGSKYANEGEETMTPPDALFANYYEGYIAEKVIDPSVVEVTLQPLVFTYKIRYEFAEGLEYVSLIRGALSGMARSVTLDTGETSAEAATLLFDGEVTDFGGRAKVTSFGVPAFPNANYPSRAEAKHALNLEVLLKNGNMLSFDYDVTDQVLAQPHGGVIVIKGIEVKVEQGVTNSGGFDVSVSDWGPYEDIVLPL